VGAVQRLATIVIIGLVAVSTILVLYLADESNRGRAKEEQLQHAAIERGQANYISLCMSCHGPAGEGYLAPGEAGTGRTGAPLKLEMYRTGVNEQGTPVAKMNGSAEGAATVISNAIHEGIPDGRGGYRMPPWGEELGGPLNDSQIEELVVFIQHADWNAVYNAAIEYAGGYPTAPPAPTTAATAEPTEAPSDGGGDSATTFDVEMVDIAFTQTELIVPANTEITINLVNNGAAVHNLHIDELGVNSGDYMAGQSGTITFNTGAPGEYEFYCSIPGHREAGMVGIIKVVEGGAAPAAANEPAAEASPAADAAEGDGAAAATSVDIELLDIRFDKTELTIPANTDVTINATNNGAAVHNFIITDTDFGTRDLLGGESESITINLPPGEYEYFCSIPGHREAGMVGKLIVQ
jgi:plastocyanin/mono/diheme cytochrome c family protein